MTMEEISVCQPPMTVNNDRGGRGIIHTVPHAISKVHVDDDDAGCDAEVMQVVGSEVSLRSKKQRINGCAVSDDELNRERPMSWEGELSDDDGELSSHVGHPCVPNGCNGRHDSNGGVESVVITTGPYVRPPQPPSSPMCISEREDSNHYPDDMGGSSEATKLCPVTKKPGHEGNTIVMVTCTNGTGGHTSPAPPGPATTAFTPAASPLLGRGQVTAFGTNNSTLLTSERLQMAHAPAAYENQLIGHRSPAQARHIVSYSRPYSQSPSPVPTRPTSSSSSRSSYSPVQSPLLSRHVSSASSLYSHTQSPLLPRHTAGTSSDGSVYSPTNSPLQGRHLPSDSVVYSPSQSPSQGRHVLQEGLSGFSPSQSPVQIRSSSLLRPVPFPSNHSPNQLHRNSLTPEHQPSTTSIDAGNIRIQSSYHYCHGEQGLERAQVSPVSQTPLQDSRTTTSSASIASSASDESNASDFSTSSRRLSADNSSEEGRMLLLSDASQSALGLSGPPSISRQQLLSGPCPICGDRISGFHYGIFSCESCKGFFKRTVQNKKNYVCLRGANCHIAINTRKKCPACRFDKCLKMGMKLEAIREDRTRGGRSTYQCSYTLPTALSDGRVISPPDSGAASGVSDSSQLSSEASSSSKLRHDSDRSSSAESMQPVVPVLIQEILSVEHLWHYTDKEINRLSEQCHQERSDGDPDFLSNLCNIADHRLYKIVKWCKSLPLFKEIQIDDQIALLINSWCELLLLSCCYRSIPTPNEIRVSLGKSVTLQEAQAIGMGPVIERMLNLTEHLRRLQVDQYEYVCLKVIILLTSDASGLREPEKVRGCQKLVIEALQTYTRTHYSQHPSKFGELLLRIPELERACQVGKDSLANKQRAGEMPSFNLLMELLRGDH